MESKLLLNPILKQLPLLQRQTVRLRNHRNHIHRLAQLLQHHNINRLERVAGGGDEIQAAMDASVLNVALALRGELFAQVGAVLVLDVLDDGVPAAVVVDEVAVAGRVDDIETEAHAVLFNDVGNGVDFGGVSDGLVGRQAAFGFDEVGGEDGVDEGTLAETGLAWGWNWSSVSCFRCGTTMG